MGSYAMTIQPSKTKTINIDGEEKKVAEYKYLCRLDDLNKCRDPYEESPYLPPYDVYADKAYKRAKKVEADYFIMKMEGGGSI